MERFKQNSNLNVSKNELKKRKRRKYPNVFYKKEIVAVFNELEDAKTSVASFLTFFCALRISETCNLKWIDIDLDNKMLKIVDGKGGKDGYVPISQVCIPILRKWKAMNPEEEYFLPPEKGEVSRTLQKRALFVRFKKALRKAGLEIKTEKNARGSEQHQYKFHTLRHSRCTHLINNGVPIPKVQYFMRHDRIDTTMTYTWITNPELNKMVEEVDSPQNKTITEET
ncbi:tyrosine-type recombinase/integrase, partial [Candidatus Woesearchaeota archaeon]|nr:tyrosine-type recombinase/integrase [Candidatus Woesearchaeota archaeon]